MLVLVSYKKKKGSGREKQKFMKKKLFHNKLARPGQEKKRIGAGGKR